jgi:hypothetical protein
MKIVWIDTLARTYSCKGLGCIRSDTLGVLTSEFTDDSWGLLIILLIRRFDEGELEKGIFVSDMVAT